MLLDLPRFITAERPTWTELERMLRIIEEDPRHRFTLEETKRFHFLYQKVAADLGRIATFAAEPELKRYLEALVARAYGEIHGTRERGKRISLFHWFWIGFPQVFRKQWAAFALSLLVTLIGVGFGGFAVALDDDAKRALLPGQFNHLIGDPAERVAEEERAAKASLDGRSTFAGFLMVNNIKVSITAMALGMTWGIGTLVILFHNGIILGLVAIDYIRAGQTVFLLGWLMPHGVIEIPSVIFAGQAGLVLGKALVGSGDRTSLRSRLLAVRTDVAILIGGVAVFLIWAGIVESFFSQYHEPILPYWLKIAFGTSELALLCWFLFFHAKSPRKNLVMATR